LLDIRDWSVACELDVAAARFLHEEELNREFEREKRDRIFWLTMFPGNEDAIAALTAGADRSQSQLVSNWLAEHANDDPSALRKKPGRMRRTLEDAMEESVLGSR